MMSIPLHQSSAPIRPPDGARVGQSPPDFSWPDLGPDIAYRMTLTYPDGSKRSRRAPQNWINWDEVLPAGHFAWHVEATGAGGVKKSRMRHFTVNTDAQPFLVPDTDTLFRRAADGAHPRALPDPASLKGMLEKRPGGLAQLLDRARGLAREADAPDGAAEGAIETLSFQEIERTLDALFAYVATGQDRHYDEALRRALNLASWDPRGSTSYATADQAARGVAATLTLAYDWLFPRLDASRKRRLLDVLEVRIGDMYQDLIGARARIAIHPYDSHGNHTLAFVAAMATVLAGDLPAAEDWLRGALPLALSWTSPWGGEDGGFGNGTAYAQWVIGDTLFAWNILRWTVGVDVAQKASVRNYGRFLAYFLPPGTPSGVFGDGAERRLEEQWARFGKAYTLFAPSPLGRWYASELSGEDRSRLHILLAPPTDLRPAPYPADTPDAALFPSIGWAAMHSDLSSRARTSIYFKSSPFGSFNHSHADQNSFVINSQGHTLAIDSGYYDGYDTPHWRQWYKQTRAHNAITYDGGQGQVVFEEAGKHGPGTITSFEHRHAHDIVSGDATRAYGGALELARRSLVYLRPDVIVVYDELASSIARRWEWNIHALNRMKVAGDGRVEIRNADASLCVEMLAGTEASFKQDTDFDAAPRGRNTPNQWHGAFIASEPSMSAEFVALLGVGCPQTAAAVTRTASGWQLTLAGRRLTLEGSRAVVEPLKARP